MRTVPLNGADGIRVNREAEARREAHGAEHPHGIFLKADGGIADAPEHLFAQIVEAARVVDDFLRLRVPEERIDGKIAAVCGFFGRAVGVVLILIKGIAVAGTRRLFVVRLGVAPEGGRFNLLLPEADEHEFEAPPDDEGIAEQAPDLVGARIGGDIEVFRDAPEQQIPYAASDEIGSVFLGRETPQHGKRVRINVADGYGGCRTETVEKRHRKKTG